MGVVRRRVSNPPNPWATSELEWLGEPPLAELEVFEEDARSLVSRNDSPDLDFAWSVNPYRGCTHGCAYCYARPTHQYLDWGAGTDFDRRIVVKRNAPELLCRELTRASWHRDPIVFSGITDCYQPLEARYELTRRCLEVCVELENPVGVITKGALVRRDIDLLQRLPAVRVYLSIPFLDDSEGLALEPWVARPSLRLRALHELSAAGISTGVAIAPLIPGLNDHLVPAILEAAREAGASSAFLTMLRLPDAVLPVFEERLREASPLRTGRVLHTIEEVRGGKLNDSRFGSRFEGRGPRWRIIAELFDKTCAQLGLARRNIGGELASGSPARQRTLFD